VIAARREDDLRVLRELLALDDERVPDDFAGMLDRLERGSWSLSERQRAWVNDVARRCDVEPSDGPEDDAPKETRLTPGPVPRGREVESMVGALPKRPPGR
jgi:hypothetical protein